MKTCKLCKQDKPEDSYSKNGKYLRPECKSCGAEYRNANKEQRKVLKKNYTKKLCDAGMCRSCAKYPVVGDQTVLCFTCWFKSLSYRTLNDTSRYQELIELYERQNKKCPYTGVELIPGTNTSLDHIKPKSKFPELMHDINNLQFVTTQVNRAKQDLSHLEFLALCAQVVSFHVHPPSCAI